MRTFVTAHTYVATNISDAHSSWCCVCVYESDQSVCTGISTTNLLLSVVTMVTVVSI